MAKVDTLPEYLKPLMMGYSIDTPYCAVCGKAYPLNRHHIVKRSAGKMYKDGVEIPKPTIMLCGSGNTSGCHGLAHQNRLHFRWVEEDTSAGDWYGTHVKGGHWEYLITDEPTKYLKALEMDGWKPIRRF